MIRFVFFSITLINFLFIALNAVNAASVTCLKTPWRIKPSWHHIVDALPLTLPTAAAVNTAGVAPSQTNVTLVECQTACYRAEATLTAQSPDIFGLSNTLWIAFGCLSDGGDEQLVQRVVDEAAAHAAEASGVDAANTLPTPQFNSTCGNQWPFVDLTSRLNSPEPARLAIPNFQSTTATFHLAMHVCDKASLMNNSEPAKCYRDEFAFCVAPYCSSQPQGAPSAVAEKQSQACKLQTSGGVLPATTNTKEDETNLNFTNTAAIATTPPPVRFINGACLVYEPNLNSGTGAYDFNITCMVNSATSGSIAEFVTSTSAKVTEQKEYSHKSSLIFHTIVQPTTQNPSSTESSASTVAAVVAEAITELSTTSTTAPVTA